MFGDTGLINADDSIAFQHAVNSLNDDRQAVSASLAQHVQRHVIPALQQFVFQSRQQHTWIRRRWTNNACKSMNNLLKLSIDWRPRRLPELVERLYSVVQMQMKDLRHVLYSHGNYTLAPDFEPFTVPHTVWQSRTEGEKDRAFSDSEFLAYTAKTKQKTTVTSTNGVFTVPARPNIAAKPRQRKQACAERAR